MRYWVTTHWPLREGWTEEASAAVWLPDGRESAGAGLDVGDMVIVYESKSGRTQLVARPDGSCWPVGCRPGREGVVYYGRVIEPLHADSEAEPEQYVDGSVIWWRWTARLEVLSRSGFLARPAFLGHLGLNPTWNLRGFGTKHSGLKEIDQPTFESIVRDFHSAHPLELPDLQVPQGHPGEGTGEGEIHLRLKRYVAEHPEEALGERGLRLLRMEYPFPCGDRADVVLADAHNRVLGVEIEPAVDDGEVVGALQAIKYRYMLEMVTGRAPGDSRAVLVAHRISNRMRESCRRYAVECVEVPESAVQ